MDVRSPLNQNIALILAGVLFLNPIVASAAQLTVDKAAGGNTSIGQAGNGVPIVNIATPNGSGLSNNKFRDYNVGGNGLILNNATSKTQSTQLGGIIVGNSNLNGKAAQVILNQVTGGSRSNLAGYTEVAGQSARVIVANPHGITCNGCGFINTPRATLTTGKPIIENGRLDRFQVDGGDISIEGQGLNASNIEQFELITRSAKLNAELQAKKLTIIAGRNDVNAETLAATARAADGSEKPLMAIDSSALGGMYAGAIRLVGTEQGVGVKLAGNMAASAGDIQIDSSGKLTLGQAAASGNVKIAADSADLTGKTYAAGTVNVDATKALNVSQSLAAAGAVTLKGAQITNSAIIEAGVNPNNSRNSTADVKLQAQTLNNRSTVVAGRDLVVGANQLNNQQGTLTAKRGVSIAATAVDNRQGQISSLGDVQLSGALNNSQGGLVTSSDVLTINAGSINNSGGELSAQNALNLSAEQLIQNQGKLLSNGSLSADLQGGDLDNRNAQINSASTLTLKNIGVLDNRAGVIGSAGAQVISLNKALNNQGGQIISDQALNISSGSLDNSKQGTLSSEQELRLTTGALNNSQEGLITSNDKLTLTAGAIENSGGELSARNALNLKAQKLVQQQGKLLSSGVLGVDLNGGDLDNSSGIINAAGNLTLNNIGALNNNAGVIGSAGAQTLELSKALSNQGGQIIGGQALNINSGSLDNSKQGALSSKQELRLITGTLNNSQDGLISSDKLTLLTGAVNNSGGEISAKTALDLKAQQLTQQQGKLLSNGSLSADLQGGDLDNTKGQISATGTVSLNNLGALNNSAGVVGSGGAQVISLSKALNNQGGQIISEQGLNIRSGSLDNSSQGSIISQQGLLLTTGELDNSQGALIRSDQLSLTAGAVNNSGSEISAKTALDLKAQQLTQQQGKLLSNGSLSADLQGGDLDNTKGQVSATGTVSLNNLGALNNSAGVVGSGGTQVISLNKALNNQGGQIISEQGLNIRSGSLDNGQLGTISSKHLLVLNTGALNNSQDGLITSSDRLALTAGAINNSTGEISAQSALQLIAQQLVQRQGKLLSNANLSVDLNGGDLDNGSGQINAAGTLLLHKMGALDNTGGAISSVGAQTIQLSKALINQSGKIISDQGLNLSSGSLDNSQLGTISSKQELALTTGTLNNSQDGLITSNDKLTLTAGAVNNDGGELSAKTALDLKAQQLTQQQGKLLSNGSLSADLQGGDLDNTKGQISATGTVALNNLGALNNRAGVVGSGGAQVINLTKALNNQGGQIISEQGLNIRSGSLGNSKLGTISSKQMLVLNTGTLNNSQDGLITSSDTLALTAGAINNSAGEISAQSALQLIAQQLVQRQGKLLSNGSLSADIQGGDLDNGSGQINAAGTLLLHNIGALENAGGAISSVGAQTIQLSKALNNHGGTIISDQGLNLSSGSLDNSKLGTISSKQELALTTGALNNSQDGLITSNDKLRLTAGAVNNDGGELSAKTALNLTAQQLTQQQGKLLSNGSLSADLQGGDLNNSKGQISAAGTVALNNLGALNNNAGVVGSAGVQTIELSKALSNQGGRIISEQGLNISSASLDNSKQGTISSQKVLELTTGALDNSQDGLITSRDKVSLIAGVVNNSGGELSAQNSLSLKVKQLIQQQGRLVSQDELTLDLAKGDLDNSGGLIAATGQLLLNNLGAVNNSGKGEISSQQSFDLKAASLDNSGQGLVLSAGQLNVSGTTLNNRDRGLLSGWQGVTVSGGSLDNSQLGTVSSRDGQLDIQLTGALNNSAQGALVSKGDQQLNAASLNNDNGIVSTDGAINLELTAALNNQHKGLINAGKALGIKAGAIDNRGGQLLTGANLLLAATSLDNSAGQLSGNGNLNLTLSGLLNNSQKGQLASAGDLLIKAASVNNTAGSLISQQALRLNAGSLSNNLGGTLAANNDLTVTLTGVLNNSADGLIYSRDKTLALTAASLNNNAGALQGKTALDLNITNALSNQNGRIGAQAGNLDISAASLDNSASGVINSLGGWLKLQLTGLFNNRSGTTQGQSLDIRSGDLDNSGGHLAATLGNSQIVAKAMNNSAGGLYAGDELSVTATTFNNQTGKVGASQIDFGLSDALTNNQGLIEASQLFKLAATGINNEQGKLRSLGVNGSSVLSGILLNNRNGTIEAANRDLSLTFTGMNNASGTVSHVGVGGLALNISSALPDNTAGKLSSNGLLSLTANNWTNNGLVQASQLKLNIANLTQGASGKLLASQSLIGTGGTWLNDGQISSDGSLNVNLTGGYSGKGSLVSLADLTFKAASLNLNDSASRVAGGANSTLTFGSLSNLGRLTSAGDLNLSATNLTNNGTLGSGENLTLNASTLRNENGLIFSGGDMALYANSLTNRFADIYSLGDLTLAKNAAGARSALLENISATIESSGDMSLDADALINRKDVFSLVQEQVSGQISVKCYDCGGDHHNVDYIATEVFNSELDQDSPSAYLLSGRDLRIGAGTLENQYSTLAASNDLSITVDSLDNIGAQLGQATRVRTWNTGRVTDGTDERFRDNYIYPYNVAALPKELPLDALSRWQLLSDVTEAVNNQVAASAIIQAGGLASLTIAGALNNSVVTYQSLNAGKDKVQDSSVTKSVAPVVVNFNPQLPPDLSQKQIDPLTLPGFSLPTGDNGLFRLSDLGQQATQVSNGGGVDAVQVSNGGVVDSAQVSTGGSIAPVAGSVASGAMLGALGQAQKHNPGTVTLDAKQVQNQNLSTVTLGSSQAQTQPAQYQNSNIQAVNTANAQAQALPITYRPAGTPNYLIETNPELTNLKSFLSSDYLLGELGYDPDRLQMRLGDGLYEQRLIREAIQARTGQRFIDGLTSDDAMFRYLMDNAIASKDQLNLSLGVALTAEQVAALTHDIVWMETRIVNGQSVLVPVLYMAQVDNRLAPNGALIQGRDVALISGSELNNQGTLRASNNLSATASNIGNSGLLEAGNRLDLLATGSINNTAGGIINGRDVSLTALTGDILNERTVSSYGFNGRNASQYGSVVDNAARIESGRDLTIQAGRDLINIGGRLESGGNARLTAERDVVIGAAQEISGQERKDRRHFWSQDSVTQHGSTVDIKGDLNASAGRDLAVVASELRAGNDLSLNAGNDLALVSASNDSSSEYHYKRSSKKIDKVDSSSQQQGSLIQAGNNLSLGAGNDIALVASSVDAGNEAYLVAANDIDIDAGFDSQSHYYYKKKKKSGTFSSSTKTRLDSTSDTFAQGSLVSGDKTTVLAGNTLNILGSDVVSTQTTTLQGGQAVNIEGVTETSTSEHYQKKTKSGLMGSGGIGVTIGSSSLQSRGQTVIETTRGSTVGSVEGNVEILTGGKLKIKGSDIVAGQNVSLYGQDVEISAAENLSRNQQEHKSKKSGLTLALSGVVGSAINTAYETSRQVDDEESGRLAALQGVKAALTGYQAMQAVEQAGGITGENAGQFVGISLSLGSQKSKSKQVQEQRVSQGSQVTAGDNITIVATGSSAANDGDVKVIGSQLQAGKDLLVQANRDIELLAAANTQKIEGKNSSGGGAVGVSLGVSDSGAGLSIFANANSGLGKEKGNATTWTETTLDAGNQVSLVSGRDTTLVGAQVSADQIKALVAGNLSLESLQDSDHYSAKQSNVSAGGSFTFGTMTGSGYLGVSKDKLNSKFDSVQEQTGLFAGNGGYQIDVGEHTQLDGSVIASTATADKNVLSTGTLGWGDISNRAEFETKTQSVNLSSGGVVGEQFIGNLATTTLLGAGNEGEDSSTTHSAISEGSLVVRDAQNQEQDTATLSRDVENANNALSPIFDKEKEQRRLREAQLIGDIGRQTIDIVRTQGEIEASRKGKEELAQSGIYEPGPGATQDERKIYQERLTNSAAYKKEMEPYGTGGSYQLVAQAATAALQGLAGNNLGSALAGASAPYLAQKIKQITGDNKEARLMAHAVLGAIVAQSNNNSAAAGAAGAVSGELSAEYIAAQLYPNKKVADLTEQEKQSVSAMATLAAGLLGGAVGGDSASAIAGAQSGKNAVENNFLSPQLKEALETNRDLQRNNEYTLATARELVSLDRADQYSDELLGKYNRNESMTVAEQEALKSYLQVYAYQVAQAYGEDTARVAVAKLLISGPMEGYYPYAASSTEQDKANSGLDVGWTKTRDQSENEVVYRDAVGVLKIGSEQAALAEVGNQALYFLGGGLGNTIRAAAAVNGGVQVGVGVKQAIEGDGWNSAANIVTGMLGVASLGVPKVVGGLGSKGTSSAGGAKATGEVGPSTAKGVDVVASQGPKELQLLPDFSNGRKAFEHYAKHSQGVILGGKGKATAKPDGADVPEFTSLDSYVSAARSFWSPAARGGVLQGTRADGSMLRFEPSTGYFGVMREGKINTFFRPSGDAAAQLKYFKDQL